MILNIKIEYRDNINPSPELELDAITKAHLYFQDFEIQLNDENAIVHIDIAGHPNYRYYFSNISNNLIHEIEKRAKRE